MRLPLFTAQASLYRTSNRYRSSGGDYENWMAHELVVAAYIPGPETRQRCAECTHSCESVRNACLYKVAAAALEQCILSGSFWGCGKVVVESLGPAADCYQVYEACRGFCHLPPGTGAGGPCCPKLCGIPNPFKDGEGCCDHGEACVGAHNPNTRDGCCPVGQECEGNCCAKDEHCLPGGICSTEPGYFENTYPPPPPPPVNNCIFGGVPCGRKCCVGDQVCCFDASLGGLVCKMYTCVN
jgi:hypothetical protein